MVFTPKGSCNAFINFIGWFLSNKSDYVLKQEPWQINVFANLIAETSYIETYNSNKTNNSEIKLLEFKESDYKNIDSGFLSPIISIQEYAKKFLKEYLIDFLIHGSIATLDYSKGWSDLDTLIIIKSSTLRNPSKLIELRKILLKIKPYLYKIDPLQHHQFIITTQESMMNPSCISLPVETIKFSKSIFNHQTIKLTLNRSPLKSKKIVYSINKLFKDSFKNGYMDHHKLNNIALEANFKNRYCMYQLKYFLSCIMTLPTYYLDAIGDSCYKKHSYEKFESLVNIDLSILEKSSFIRKNWPNNESFPYEGNFIPDWICEVLDKNYFEEAYKFSSAVITNIKFELNKSINNPKINQ